jgi:hypothetical protein
MPEKSMLSSALQPAAADTAAGLVVSAETGAAASSWVRKMVASANRMENQFI